VKTLLKITSGVGVAALLFAGYVFLSAVPEVARCVRMNQDVRVDFASSRPGSQPPQERVTRETRDGVPTSQ
jgi:hypothetical protein